jgi:hypothetical protein
VQDTGNAKAGAGHRTESLEGTVPNPEPLHHLVLTTLSRFFPEGGQRTARRNAWAAMSSNASRARDRREADAAIVAAVGRASALGSGKALGTAPAGPRRVSTI